MAKKTTKDPESIIEPIEAKKVKKEAKKSNKKSVAKKVDEEKKSTSEDSLKGKEISISKKTTTKKSASSDKDKTVAEKKVASTLKKDAKKKSNSTSKKGTEKKSSSKSEKVVEIKPSSKSKKVVEKKPSSKSKKVAEKKSTSKQKKVVEKKSSSVTKKTSTINGKEASYTKRSVNSLIKNFQSEYYDLPYYYNKTVVKILAQTPKTLFVYWEISETDRNNFKKQYGENFFEVTRPVLIIFNDTMHYSFEVDINDFANSWYLHINDANCDYHVELGRRPIPFANQSYPQNNQEVSKSYNQAYIPYYVYLTSSNKMTAPNNKILFDPDLKIIRFRNIKTNQIIEKDIKQFRFITNYGIFTISELYNYLYPDESFEIKNNLFIGNPTSGGLTSSGMF